MIQLFRVVRLFLFSFPYLLWAPSEKPSLRYPPFLRWNNPLCDRSYSLCTDDNSADSIEKTAVSDSHRPNSLRVAWPRGFPLSLCPGFGDSLLIWGGRLPHAKNNSRYARCTLLSSRTRGKFDKHWIVSLCATLMCSLPVSDASRSLVFPTPLRMQWVRWKNFWAGETMFELSYPLHCLKAVCYLCSPPSAVKHPAIQTCLLNSCLY